MAATHARVALRPPSRAQMPPSAPGHTSNCSPRHEAKCPSKGPTENTCHFQCQQNILQTNTRPTGAQDGSRAKGRTCPGGEGDSAPLAAEGSLIGAPPAQLPLQEAGQAFPGSPGAPNVPPAHGLR